MNIYESEETEVKNIEELKSWFEDDKLYVGEYVKHKINQLDEPEVLSQKWISENVEYAYFDMLDGSGRLSSATAIIKPEKLQNLLVPKQEEVTEEQAWEKIKDIYGVSNESFVRSVMRLVMEHVKDDTTIGEIREKLESEALSQKWIDWHKEFVGKRPDGTRVEVVKEKYLQNLLVPKQELPVIPKFVADWIEEMKQDERPLYSVMSSLMNKTNHEWAVWKSANKDFSEIVAQAWLDGYTVEEEQKYYVLDKENATLLKKSAVGEGVAKSVGTNIYNAKSWKNEENYQLTEQEIKDYDERYFAFTVKVEELEEC